jgi:hypothetical protein
MLASLERNVQKHIMYRSLHCTSIVTHIDTDTVEIKKRSFTNEAMRRCSPIILILLMNML